LSNNLQSLSRTIRQRRVELGLSQDDLAQALGVSRTTISQIENGRPGTVALLLNVLDSLGLDLLVAPRHSNDALALRNNMTRTYENTNQHVRVKRSLDE